MINRLFGTVTYKQNQTLHLLSNGIEWEILTTTTSLAELSPIDEEAGVYTFLYHREDQMAMYGFASEEERRLFLELIKVSGIGPKQACRILSNISNRMLLEALNSEDVDTLTKLPGLGKKTAQKIILALRGKLSSELKEDNQYADIIEALGNMGFDRGEAKRVVAGIAAKPEFAALKDAEAEQFLMKEAIIGLSK